MYALGGIALLLRALTAPLHQVPVERPSFLVQDITRDGPHGVEALLQTRKPLVPECDRILGCTPNVVFANAWRGHSAGRSSFVPVVMLGTGLGVEAPLLKSAGVSIAPMIFAKGLGFGLAATF